MVTGKAKLIAFPLLVVVLLFAALTPAQALTVGATITIEDHISPTVVTIAPGEAVEFVNNGTGRHRMRSTAGPEDFDAGDLDPGDSSRVVLTLPGTYLYEDHRHDHDARFRGTIIVSSDSSSNDVAAPGKSRPSGSAVSILDRSFAPASISVVVGTTVKWTNTSGRDHTVTARDRGFDSRNLSGGATYSRTFNTPGDFAYFCTIHPKMVGVISVSVLRLSSRDSSRFVLARM